MPLHPPGPPQALGKSAALGLPLRLNSQVILLVCSMNICLVFYEKTVLYSTGALTSSAFPSPAFLPNDQLGQKTLEQRNVYYGIAKPAFSINKSVQSRAQDCDIYRGAENTAFQRRICPHHWAQGSTVFKYISKAAAIGSSLSRNSKALGSTSQNLGSPFQAHPMTPVQRCQPSLPPLELASGSGQTAHI